MDNSNSNTSDNKHKIQMQLRKTKLEKIRKERQMLQIEKLKREMLMEENLKDIRFQNEMQEKGAKLNDLKLDEIQREINTFCGVTKTVQSVDLSSQANGTKIRSANQALNLKFSNLQITEIAPIKVATYSKHTQTEVSQLYNKNYEPANDDTEYEEDEDMAPLRLFCNFSSNLPPGILSPGLPKIMDIPPALTPIDKENPWNYLQEKKKKIAEIEYGEIVSHFQSSLIHASLVMERALSNNKNIYVDYIGDGNGCKVTDDSKSIALLNLNHVFYNKEPTERRCITSIDWSPHYPDQIACSYYKNESTFDKGEDVKIWSQNMTNQKPQQVFQCHSSVMSICLAKCSPNLLFGATYSGQIVLWDSRVKTSTPVQFTKLNYKAHTQPIYCLREIGFENSHYIISVSTDGKLCLWNLDMLVRPIDITQLHLNASDKIKNPISVTCMDFPVNGINNLVFGGEDGYAYSAFRYGYETGINNRYGRHNAPITSISSHYNQTTTEFGNLFLTSSIDCVIKLWSMEESSPLHTFKNNDYIMDVAWSPIHPAIFIAVDGSGCLDLYNLNENFDEPIKSINIKDNTAINRVAWKSDGQHIALGTEYGELYLYSLSEDLANPRSEEWNIFNETLQGKTINYGIDFFD